MKIYISIIFFLVPYLLYSQNNYGMITGRVFDKTNNEVLIGGTIIIQNTKLGAATDANGEYTINNIPFGKYNIKIRYIGYKELNDTLVFDSKRPIIKKDYYLDTLVNLPFGYGPEFIIKGYFSKSFENNCISLCGTHKYYWIDAEDFNGVFYKRYTELSKVILENRKNEKDKYLIPEIYCILKGKLNDRGSTVIINGAYTFRVTEIIYMGIPNADDCK